jgi:hypothetical protein
MTQRHRGRAGFGHEGHVCETGVKVHTSITAKASTSAPTIEAKNDF